MSHSLQKRKVIDVVISDIQEEHDSKQTIIRHRSVDPDVIHAVEDREIRNNHDSKYNAAHAPETTLEKPNAVIHLVSGAFAGAVAKTTISPFDRTKIWFQVTNKRFTMYKAYTFLVESYQKDGFLSLWRGNSATMVRIIPYSAVQFASHEKWKKAFNVDGVNNRNTPWLRFVAGSMAGVTAQVVAYPLDLVRARMAVTPRNQYGSMADVFVKSFRHEGFLGFYRGLTPTIIGVIPYAGISFGIYETLKNYHKNNTGQEKPSAIERTLFGAFAGLLGQSSSYPLDIVRRRMQTAHITGNGNNYTSIISTLKIVYTQEGIVHGLYKGLSLNWIKGPIAVGVSFAMYDSLKDFLQSKT